MEFILRLRKRRNMLQEAVVSGISNNACSSLKFKSQSPKGQTQQASLVVKCKDDIGQVNMYMAYIARQQEAYSGTGQMET